MNNQSLTHTRGCRLGVLSSVLAALTFTIPQVVAAAPTIPVKCTGSTAKDPLQPAINKAPKGATLVITGTCVGNFKVTNKNLVLQGNGIAPTLFGRDSGTVLLIRRGPGLPVPPVPTVTIKGLTVTGGNAALGGGIRNRGGSLTVVDSTVTGNRAESAGAGVYNDPGSTIRFSNSKVTGNSISVPVPEPLLDDEFVDSVGVPVDVTGAGIANAGTATLVNNTAVAGNFADPASATLYGGGIWNMGRLTLTDSTVEGNTGGEGGGIHNANGSVKLNQTVVRGNRSVVGAAGSGWGGGICNQTGSVVLNRSTVTGNLAETADGGIWGAATLTNGSNVSGNYAPE